MNAKTPSYHGYRFPPEIISHSVWLYYRFCLSFRDVEDLLAERGITVSYETIRQWSRKFGAEYARKLKRREGRLGDTWLSLVKTSSGRRSLTSDPFLARLTAMLHIASAPQSCGEKSTFAELHHSLDPQADEQLLHRSSAPMESRLVPSFPISNGARINGEDCCELSLRNAEPPTGSFEASGC